MTYFYTCPDVALTKDEHDEIVARKGRPLTQDDIHRRPQSASDDPLNHRTLADLAADG